MDIYGKIGEIESTLNTIASAVNNEYDPPKLKDIQNTLVVTLDYVKTLKKDVFEYMEIQT